MPVIEFEFREGVSYSAWLLERAVLLGQSVLLLLSIIETKL